MTEIRFSIYQILTLEDERAFIVTEVDVTKDGKTISYELAAYDQLEGTTSDKRYWIGDHQIKRVPDTGYYRFELELEGEAAGHLLDALDHIDKAVAFLSNGIIEHNEVDRVFRQLRALVQPKENRRDVPCIENGVQV